MTAMWTWMLAWPLVAGLAASAAWAQGDETLIGRVAAWAPCCGGLRSLYGVVGGAEGAIGA